MFFQESEWKNMFHEDHVDVGLLFLCRLRSGCRCFLLVLWSQTEEEAGCQQVVALLPVFGRPPLCLTLLLLLLLQLLPKLLAPVDPGQFSLQFVYRVFIFFIPVEFTVQCLLCSLFLIQFFLTKYILGSVCRLYIQNLFLIEL